MYTTTYILVAVAAHLAAWTQTATLAHDPLLANTMNGPLRGKYNPNMVKKVASLFGVSPRAQSRVWAGIPFAQPPVGQNRFRSPQPLTETWGNMSADGRLVEGIVRPATKFPHPCPQNWITTGTQSENCLFLNVFVPPASRTPPGTRLPVMVWIYGGAFYFGDSYMTGVYNARYLVETKDVLLVTINYRLGAFGFFDTNETGANFGIEDQRMALEWIQANIVNFGGDPERVTIYGLSAGATSTAVHLTSPLTRPGLFSRVIHQSGPLGTQMRSRKDIQKASRELAHAVGCLKPDGFSVDVACMRRKSMKEILVATKENLNDPNSRPKKSDLSLFEQSPDDRVSDELGDQYRWWPSIDNKNIVGQPRDLFRQGRYLHVPVIFGVTREEGAYWMLPLDNVFKGKKKARTGFNQTAQLAHMKRTFGSDATRVMKVYPVHADIESNINEMIRLSTDYAFTCPTQRAAENMAQHGDKNVYFYELTQPGFPPYGHCARMACHGTELPIMFRTLWPLSKRREALQEKILTYWTNFATTGNPNLGPNSRALPPHIPEWPAFDSRTRQHQELGDTTRPRGVIRDDVCRMWNDELGYGFDDLEPSFMDVDVMQQMFSGVLGV